MGEDPLTVVHDIGTIARAVGDPFSVAWVAAVQCPPERVPHRANREQRTRPSAYC